MGFRTRWMRIGSSGPLVEEGLRLHLQRQRPTQIQKGKKNGRGTGIGSLRSISSSSSVSLLSDTRAGARTRAKTRTTRWRSTTSLTFSEQSQSSHRYSDQEEPLTSPSSSSPFQTSEEDSEEQSGNETHDSGAHNHASNWIPQAQQTRPIARDTYFSDFLACCGTKMECSMSTRNMHRSPGSSTRRLQEMNGSPERSQTPLPKSLGGSFVLF